MRIHHLNCGTHCPLGGAFFDGASRGLFATVVTHCLLIETDRGLVLVDTGYGLQDVRHPHQRLARALARGAECRLPRARHRAACKSTALGFSARDVRHIVLTHLDFDHAGGLEDFPAGARPRHGEGARCRGAQAPRVRRAAALPAAQWDEVRDWRTYAAGGEPWFGFEAVRDLDGLPPEILMIPLPGHTAGHAGVAVRTTDGWLLNAGDAYLHDDQMKVTTAARPAWRSTSASWIRTARRGAPTRSACASSSGSMAQR